MRLMGESKIYQMQKALQLVAHADKMQTSTKALGLAEKRRTEAACPAPHAWASFTFLSFFAISVFSFFTCKVHLD